MRKESAIVILSVGVILFYLSSCDRISKPVQILRIGNQIWMAHNVNMPLEGSWCYDGDEKNCQKYGRIYNWHAACKACPPGYKLPSKEEFEELIDYLGGEQTAKKRLLPGGDSGFNALLGGGTETEGSCLDMSIKGYFWTSTETDVYSNEYAWYYYAFGFDYENYGDTPMLVVYNKRGGANVRCIKAKQVTG